MNLWKRFESFLSKALVAGILAVIAWYVISHTMPESSLRDALLLVPGIVIVADFVIFGLLVLASPFMWLWAIIVGTVGAGVAVGNRISRQ